MRNESSAAVFGGKRNQDIEILRGVAILFVLVDHIIGIWDMPRLHSALAAVATFWSGVDLFFVISGFVITQSVLHSMAGVQSPQDKLKVLVVFWIKRVWRLWPAAWFWLFLPFVVACIAIPEMRHGSDLRGNVSYLFGGMLSVVNFQNWAFNHHHGMATLFATPYWSLSLEEQFYLLCAPLLLFVRRKWIITLMLLAIAVQFPMVRSANTDDLSWFIRSDAFAWGVLLSLFVSSRIPVSIVEPKFLRSRSFALPLLLLVLMSIAVMPQLMFSLPFGVGLIAALSGLLVFIASYDKGYLGLRGYAAKLLAWVGDRSYAIYLVNGSVVALGVRFPPFNGMNRSSLPDVLLMSGIFLACILIFAELTYRYIEVPARLHGRKLAKAYSTAQQIPDHQQAVSIHKTRRESEAV